MFVYSNITTTNSKNNIFSFCCEYIRKRKRSKILSGRVRQAGGTTTGRAFFLTTEAAGDRKLPGASGLSTVLKRVQPTAVHEFWKRVKDEIHSVRREGFVPTCPQAILSTSGRPSAPTDRTVKNIEHNNKYITTEYQ